MCDVLIKVGPTAIRGVTNLMCLNGSLEFHNTELCVVVHYAPVNDLPHSPHAGNTRGLSGVLPEIFAQTKGDLPFPNGKSLRMHSRPCAPRANCRYNNNEIHCIYIKRGL